MPTADKNTPTGKQMQGIALSATEQDSKRADISATTFETFANDHPANCLSIQDGWHGVSNVATTDNLAPQENGLPTPLIGKDLTTTSNFAGRVRVEHMIVTNTPGYLQSLRLWPSDVGDNVRHTLTVFNDTEVRARVITLPPLTANEWNIVALDSLLTASGTTFRVVYETINYGTNTEVKGGWTKLDSLGTNPATGQWSVNAGGTQLKIAKIDLDGTDRNTELSGLNANTELSFIETSQQDRSTIYHATGVGVDNGTYYTYPCNKVGEGAKGEARDGQICTCSFVTAATISTDYGHLPLGITDPSWGGVSSELYFDDVEQPDVPDFYGIDLTYQPLTVSSDWTLLGAPPNTL